MTSRFASLTEQVIEKIVEDKDTQNTKRSTKVAKELFADYVKEKKLSEARRSMYNKTVIRFHFCDIRNYQGLSKGYGLSQ